MNRISETETVIKRIVPYLQRKGYDLEADMTFEEPTETPEERRGFIDILITCGRKTACFVIEAKRDGTKFTNKHRKQAINYGRSKKVLFIALTNGKQFELLNTQTSEKLKYNGSALNRLPSKPNLLNYFIPQLKKDIKSGNITIPDHSLPFRPGLPLTKLNHLIKQCHNSIRNIEKNEEHAFEDFSKILFLKLLEEKWDSEGFQPPYTYMFHELANKPKEQADQVKTAIKSMIKSIKENTKYGDVLTDQIWLKKDAAYLTIVQRLSGVSFRDCDLDTKGAAFEYFVRATLKGKKLGQYFTPRPLVKLMLHLGKYKQIVNNLRANLPFKVLDPACGSGGFLVFGMNLCIKEVDNLKNTEIHGTLAKELEKKLKEDTFYGIDAHEGVACSAKMNMIIAGDGHNNIICADSLKEGKLVPTDDGLAHLILTNPPFGTSEEESLNKKDLEQYAIKTTKGQSLFIQKMILSVHKNSRIVSVIDEGVLNTASHYDLRTHIMKECKIEYILSLPDETFKPNKINVKSGVLVLQKRNDRDEDLEEDYLVKFIDIHSMGYDGAGEEIRGFDSQLLIEQIEAIHADGLPEESIHERYFWSGFKVPLSKIINDRGRRLDSRYWNPITIGKTANLTKGGGCSLIKDINLIETKRGSSPFAAEYVSELEGYALVVKAGTNISKLGELLTTGDYIEEGYYKEKYKEPMILKDGDILLASTGDGTLGKCCVYRNVDEKGKNKPAIADGHVTVIRVNQNEIYPEYLCDYLRKGFGAEQINRLFTGATGLVEIQPEDVDEIIISPLPLIETQKMISNKLRHIEQNTSVIIKTAINKLSETEQEFFNTTFCIK